MDISKDSIYFTTSSVNKDMLIAQNETIELVKLDPGCSNKSSARLLNLIHNDSLNFIIEYESIYGEKWKISLKDYMPQKKQKIISRISGIGILKNPQSILNS